MPSIACHCPGCKQYNEIPISSSSQKFFCPNCQKNWGSMEDARKIFDYCPICQGRQFYAGKDFNQFLGCLIVLPGIILVPWTYGLSLPFFAFLDWLFYKRVPLMVSCYKCGADFRNFSIPKHIKPFMHHIGLKYDKYR